MSSLDGCSGMQGCQLFLGSQIRNPWCHQAGGVFGVTFQSCGLGLLAVSGELPNAPACQELELTCAGCAGMSI